jgi:hypothetical protein
MVVKPGFEDNYTFGAAVLRMSLGQQKEKVALPCELTYTVCD